MFDRSMARAAALGLGLFAQAWACAGAKADPVEDFYRGRNVSFLVGVSAGGAYDLQLRMVARHMVRFIPGKPVAVPQNMTGATGLVMANYMFRVAPRDGSVIGLIQNGLPTYQAVGKDKVQYDARAFQWIGSLGPTIEIMFSWNAIGVRSIEDAKKRTVVAGSNGASGITYMFPLMLNDMVGTKFRMVTGYVGSGGLNLALERGEVEARNNSWASIKSSKPDWVQKKQISVLVFAGPRPADLPDTPSMDDLITDPANRQIARVVIAGSALGHPFAVAPDVPADRVAALRAAFVAMTKDPDFLREAKAAQIDVEPIAPEGLKKVVDDLFATPQALRDKARKYFD